VVGALAMLFAILPLAFILSTVSPVVGSEAIELAVFEFAFEFVAIVIVFDDIIWHL